MPSLTVACPHCHKLSQQDLRPESDLACPFCHQPWGRVERLDKIADRCPVCSARQFYRQKDFARGIGCVIVLVGILLVPKTYGLSLPACALIDWLLYRKKSISTMLICYKCGAEYRGVPVPERLKPYMHHIGLKYDKSRLNRQ